MNATPPEPPLERREYKQIGVSPKIQEYINLTESRTMESQHVIDLLTDMCERLKEKDISAYGQLVKRVRHIIGDSTTAPYEENATAWDKVAGAMKEDPVWPDIMQIIDYPSD